MQTFHAGFLGLGIQKTSRAWQAFKNLVNEFEGSGFQILPKPFAFIKKEETLLSLQALQNYRSELPESLHYTGVKIIALEGFLFVALSPDGSKQAHLERGDFFLGLVQKPKPVPKFELILDKVELSSYFLEVSRHNNSVFVQEKRGPFIACKIKN